MLATIQEHIDATPGVCGGKPRIAGHRIRVQDVVICHEQQGMSPDEIASAYGRLGVQVLETQTSNIGPNLVSAYLDLKKRNLL